MSAKAQELDRQFSLSESSKVYRMVLMQLKLADEKLGPGEYLSLLDDVIGALEVKRDVVRTRIRAAVEKQAVER